MAQAAYIHIPFCAHKCDFCDFAAFAGVDDLSEQYVDTVVKEIEERVSLEPNDDKLTSVFYGGGTPGYIDPPLLARVHRKLEQVVGFADGAEITMETTPQSITVEKAKQWREIGINRISVGVQSFIDSELKAMGRDHTSNEAIRGIENALAAGYQNVALDLMYGLPEQTPVTWSRTLSVATSLGLPHMSAYGLTIATNSPLLSRFPLDSTSYPNEAQYVEMYEMLLNSCSSAGLQQYEISNFAKPGFTSQHNVTYWSNEEYLGFGVSAHRYVNKIRSSNYRSLKRYMRDCLANETLERIDKKTRAKEAIFLGLRLRRGLHLDTFKSKYGFDIEQLLKEKITRLEDGGFLTVEDGWLRLSQNGVLVSNLVLAELV